VRGGNSPWYVFRGHFVPTQSEDPNYSLVSTDVCPTPPQLMKTLNRIPDRHHQNDKTPKSRYNDANIQWSLGFEGSGAPVHFHNTAW
jgi:hypothetical protein